MSKDEIWSHPRIQQIVEQEKDARPLLSYAASIPPCYNRWPLYERFKRCASLLVGWNARHEGLRTSEHYEVMMWALDTLLPETSLQLGAPEPEQFFPEIEKIEQRIWGVGASSDQPAFVALCASHGWKTTYDDLSVTISRDGIWWRMLGWKWDIEAMKPDTLSALLIALAVPVTEREKEAAE
jgi:hypothetical protein